MSQKKDIKLVKKILKSDAKCLKYSDGELQYMKMWLQVEKLTRKRRKNQEKSDKGFSNE